MIHRPRQDWWADLRDLDDPDFGLPPASDEPGLGSQQLRPKEQQQQLVCRPDTALVPPPTGETIEEVSHRVDLEDYVDPDGCSSYCHGGLELASRFGADDQFNDRQTAYSPPSKSHGGRAGTTLGNDNIMHAKVSSGAIEHCCQ
jgi:hypothetical protein